MLQLYYSMSFDFLRETRTIPLLPAYGALLIRFRITLFAQSKLYLSFILKSTNGMNQDK